MNIRSTELALLTVGAALLVGYAGARAYGEGERRAAVETFMAEAATDTDPDAAIAILRAPRLALEVPVFAGTGERDLNRGAGHIEGTALPGADGNSGIAAHRDGYFRALKDVVIGDTFEISTADGARSYRVAAFAVVDPEDVSSLNPTGEAALTLVTCHPFYFVGNAPQRFVVRAVAVH